MDPDLTVLSKVNFTPSSEMLEAQLKSDIIGRILAVQQLGKKKDAATVKQLEGLIAGDPHHAVKTEAVEALRGIPSDAAREALIALTANPDERVRRSVADALSSSLHPDAHTALVKMAAAEKNPVILSAIVSSFAAWPQEDLTAFLKKPS